MRDQGAGSRRRPLRRSLRRPCAEPPTMIEGIEKYLGSGMIRGIGPIYAKKLVRAFGDAVFDVAEQGRAACVR